MDGNERTFICFYENGICDAEHGECERTVYLNADKITSIELHSDRDCCIRMENGESYFVDYGHAKPIALADITSKIDSVEVKYALLKGKGVFNKPTWEIKKIFNPSEEELAKYSETFDTKEEAYAEGIKYYDYEQDGAT